MWLILSFRLERVLQEDASNQRRHDLLQYLQSQIGDKSLQLPEELDIWVQEQEQIFLDTLKRPAEDEQALILQLAVDNGGTGFLRKRYIWPCNF